MSLKEIIAEMNPTLWVFAGLLICWVFVQSGLFVRLALNFNKKNHLVAPEELKQAFSTGFVSVVGPAISVIITAISLIAMVGSAVTFMRCGVIGAPMWELMMAEYSAQSAGVAFGGDGFTHNIFVLCIAGMTFASAPYFINTMITLKPMDLAVINAQKGAAAGEKKESFIPVLGSAAMMGMMGYNLITYFETLPKSAAFLSAMACSIVLGALSKKVKGLATWSMAIAMVVGMLVGQTVATFVG